MSPLPGISAKNSPGNWPETADSPSSAASSRPLITGPDQPTEQPQPYAILRPMRGVFEDDWRAHVTRHRPWPVILLHGTGQAKGIWQDLGTELREDGWAVFAPDFGNRATSPLSESLDMVTAYIRAVRHATGAHRTIIVGHSQGGLLATLLSLHHPHKVRHVVCLAAPNHGTSLGGVANALTRIPGTKSLMSNFVQSYWGPSGLEQLTGSTMVLANNDHDILAPGVSYTCMATRYDQLISPTSSCFLNDGGTGTVENLYVQDRFPQSVILHEHMATDHRVRALVRESLFTLAGETFSAEDAVDEYNERRKSRSR